MHVMTKTTGLSESELREKIYDGENLLDNASEILINLDADRVSAIKTSVEKNIDKTKLFDDAYNKATLKEREKFEKKFKEATGFESDKQGLELVQAWGETLKEGTQITDDDIKKHPKYLELERGLSGNHKEVLATLQKDFDTYKRTVERDATMSGVLDKIETVFMSLNPVLSSDPIKAKNQKDLFFEQFKNYEYGEADGKHFLMEDGKRKEDEHGHAIYLDTLVSNLTNQFFDVKVQDQRDNAGNQRQSSTTTTAPKTEAEYNKAVANATSDKEVVELGAAWKAEQGNQ